MVSNAAMRVGVLVLLLVGMMTLVTGGVVAQEGSDCESTATGCDNENEDPEYEPLFEEDALSGITDPIFGGFTSLLSFTG